MYSKLMEIKYSTYCKLIFCKILLSYHNDQSNTDFWKLDYYNFCQILLHRISIRVPIQTQATAMKNVRA